MKHKIKFNVARFVEQGIKEQVLANTLDYAPSAVKSGARLQREIKAFMLGTQIANGRNKDQYYIAYKDNMNPLKIAQMLGDIDLIDFKLIKNYDGTYYREQL